MNIILDMVSRTKGMKHPPKIRICKQCGKELQTKYTTICSHCRKENSLAFKTNKDGFSRTEPSYCMSVNCENRLIRYDFKDMFIVESPVIKKQKILICKDCKNK